ncbi:MAG TPA: TetR/AcrR family transcriptional regulator [Brumimicrobium sp.]|nr:TetR/AcrR family transcriptional regulator [Brumimicrobium sp.]
MECDTESLIKRKAKELYFSKGVFDASTQEIADFAGVNRTLVNYYFRSKKNLFQIVYSETIEKMKKQYATIYIAHKPFRDKVEDIIDFTIQFKEKYPYLEIFNIQEFNKPNPEDIFIPKQSEEIKVFLKEIEEEMEKGTLEKYEPINFFINIISLISFPMVMKTLFTGIFNIESEKDYQRIYKQRKEMAMTILFKNKN